MENTKPMSSRYIKILFGASVSLYVLLVCFNNISDYDSNFQFVSMVSGMDDVFSKTTTGWRSIQNTTLHHVIYVCIIGWELCIAVLSLAGMFRMIRSVKSDADEFNHSKQFLITGLALGVLLWFAAFIAIGGEWFLMWQSKTWNGQQTAFMLTICFLLFLIYMSRHDE